MGVCQSTALKCIFELGVCVQSLADEGFISCCFFQNKVLQILQKRQAGKHLNEQAEGEKSQIWMHRMSHNGLK